MIPTAHLYTALMTQSTYYTLNDNLGRLFQALLCQHLQNESFRVSNMGRFTHISLVWIPCDLFYDMQDFNDRYDMVYQSRLSKNAVLERFYPVRSADSAIEQWPVEFSKSDFKSVSRIGTLEHLTWLFRFCIDSVQIDCSTSTILLFVQCAALSQYQN